MTEIQGKSILVRVGARFELSGVDCSQTRLDKDQVSFFLPFKEALSREKPKDIF